MRLLPRSIACGMAAGAVAAAGAAIVVVVAAAGRDGGDVGAVWIAPFMLAAVAARRLSAPSSSRAGPATASAARLPVLVRAANLLPIGIEDSAGVCVFWPFFAGMLIALFGGAAAMRDRYRRARARPPPRSSRRASTPC